MHRANIPQVPLLFNKDRNMSKSKPFWQTTSLEKMTDEQWESLCDHCARCCLQKLEDEETSKVYYTDIVCRYLDQPTCQCTEYTNRRTLVPTCFKVTPEGLKVWDWLPPTCAYRLLAEGQDLPEWHPLIQGDREAMKQAGIPVSGRVVSEEFVHPDEWEERVIFWV